MNKDTYFVKDLNAREPGTNIPLKRIHDFRNSETGEIKQFIFENFYDAIPVPTNYAAKIVGVPGFEVRNSAGVLVQPRKEKHAMAGEVTLAPDQAVVTLDMLTVEALRSLLAQKGVKNFPSTVKKDLVEALIQINIDPQSVKTKTVEVEDTHIDYAEDEAGPVAPAPVKTSAFRSLAVDEISFPSAA